MVTYNTWKEVHTVFVDCKCNQMQECSMFIIQKNSKSQIFPIIISFEQGVSRPVP